MPENTKSLLVNAYRNFFDAIPADTPELKREAHRLRYQVYCVEHQFEDPRENPGGLEFDEYDEHAIHGVLIHRPSGLTAGTVRLVLHKPDSKQGCLPIHSICSDPRIHDPLLFPLEQTCELSRFAVSKDFRRRIGDATYGRVEELIHGDPRRVIPHITLGLMAVALQMGLARGLTTVCAVMEPALLRLVARLGFHFEQLGPPVQHHGWRQPCYADAATLFRGVELEHPDLWELITDRGRLLSGRTHDRPKDLVPCSL